MELRFQFHMEPGSLCLTCSFPPISWVWIQKAFSLSQLLLIILVNSYSATVKSKFSIFIHWCLKWVSPFRSMGSVRWVKFLGKKCLLLPLVKSARVLVVSLYCAALSCTGRCIFWHLVFKLVDWKNAVWMSVFLSCHVVSSHSVLVFYIEDAFCSHNPFYRWRRLLRLKNVPKLEIVSVGNQGLHQICLILKHVC